MAGDRFSPGQRWRPTAGQLNDFADAADWVRNANRSGGSLPFPLDEREVVSATVKNETGGNRGRSEVVGLAAPIFTPQESLAAFKSRLGLVVVRPTLPAHARQFAVLLRPVDEHALTRACVAGAVPVKLKVVKEFHAFAHISAVAGGETTHLVSDCVGYPILWKDSADHEDEDGLRWAIVELGGSAPTMGIWHNVGQTAVSAHGCFQVSGAEGNESDVLRGVEPTDRFRPPYRFNGSEPVASNAYGVYQRSSQVFAEVIGTFSSGRHLGSVPGLSRLEAGRPPLVRCLGQPEAGLVEVHQIEPLQRFKLYERLYECRSATAQILGLAEGAYTAQAQYALHTVRDTLARVENSPLALFDPVRQESYIPSGTCLLARYAGDATEYWEPLEFDPCDCAPPGSSGSFSTASSSSDSSGSTPSGSQPSGSQPSGSQGPGSSSASAPSGSPSDNPPSGSTPSGNPPSGSIPSGTPSGSGPSDAQPSSGQPSESAPPGSDSSGSGSGASDASGSDASLSGSAGSGSDSSGASTSTSDLSASGPSGSGGSGSLSGSDSGGSDSSPSTSGSYSDSGSDKSTAIVKASWTKDGYVGLHVVESPGVPFVDLLIDQRMPQVDTVLQLDPQLQEVCEPSLIRVSGWSTDLPVHGVGLSIRGSRILVRFGNQRPERMIELQIQLWATRRGFKGWRFPNRTKEQFDANEKTIQSAYPGAGRP